MVATIAWENRADGTTAISTDGSTWVVPTLDSANAAIFERNVRRWETLARPIAEKAGVPLAPVMGVIKSESNGFERARNPNDGGTGLMQVTGANKQGVSEEALYDPATNIRMGVAILAAAFADGHDLPRAASIYNAGEPFILVHADGTSEWLPGTPENVRRGARRSYQPWTNEAWAANGRKIALMSRWGLACSPGYIDSVVASTNYYLGARSDDGGRVASAPPSSAPSSVPGSSSSRPPPAAALVSGPDIGFDRIFWTGLGLWGVYAAGAWLLRAKRAEDAAVKATGKAAALEEQAA